ncbi:hypothetical protein BKA61DRAFT_708486 [Leptodontidium sp. MPI-SDFR-AT-0119]|nr:hypothetical protein BKA61DRAFT_708486 [Leptodontidium sp. MPI-SDFR-AT-0119]
MNETFPDEAWEVLSNVGAFITIPFALKYGRRPIYICNMIIQFFVAIWSAKIQTPVDYTGTNIVGCGVGALAEVIVQMMARDMFSCLRESTVAAGYIVSAQGWRWVWWWNVIIFGVMVLLFVFTYEETNFVSPALLRDSMSVAREAAVVSGEGERDPDAKDLTKDLLVPIYQPVVVLFTISTVFYMSLIYAVISAWQTIMITVLSSAMPMPPYSFTSSQIGFMSLPGFIGTSLGVTVTSLSSDHSILAAPISAMALTYITDSYSEIVGPSLVAVTFTRNLIATILVFALTPRIERMGIQNCVITIYATGMFILCFVALFIWKGKRFRVWTAERREKLAEKEFEVGKV